MLLQQVFHVVSSYSSWNSRFSMNLKFICPLLLPCDIGYQTMKMLIYKNCLDWHRFTMPLVTDQSYKAFYVIYIRMAYKKRSNSYRCQTILVIQARVIYDKWRSVQKWKIENTSTNDKIGFEATTFSTYWNREDQMESKSHKILALN